MWIHEHPDWPKFTWDMKSLTFKLADVRHRQGLLLGQMEGLGFDLKQEASLNVLTSDVIKTSAIEGERLNREEVRSSIARRLGIEIAGMKSSNRNVEGIVEIMLDATQQFQKPLTKDRLFDWHAALFPTGRSGMQKITVGNWRTLDAGSMQVVSGALGREKVHFEAPNADRLEKEMQVFLDWFNNTNDLDPVLKSGISHFWFVTIHPFEDGNGRIARAIADMVLARADGIPYRFYSLSSQIEADRKNYYNKLEKQQRNTPQITEWLEWFFNCLGSAISSAENILAQALFKEKFWKEINKKSINERQRFVINRMLASDFKGNMKTSKYAIIAKCSTDTALRDIQDLEEKNVFIKNSSGGRSTSYSLAK